MLLENCIEVFLCLAAVYALRELYRSVLCLAAVYALRRVYTMQRCCLQRESRLLATALQPDRLV